MAITIYVKVFATLVRHMPGVSAGAPFEIELPAGATVQTLVERLELPQDEVKVVFVNGRARPADWMLAAGDEVGIFPPIGGG